MFKPIREFFNALSDAQQAVITIVGVVAMIAAGWATVIAWFDDLSPASIFWYSIAVACLILIFIVASITWWRKHDIDNLPNYLCQLDAMVRDYVNNLAPDKANPDDWANCTRDLGELWHIDVRNLATAVQQQDKIRIKKMSFSTSSMFSNMTDPKERSSTTLKSLLTASGIMNFHCVGLDVVKKTDNYQRLFTKIKNLQRIAPSAEVNIKINEYFNWSDGLYSMLLGYRLIYDKPELLSLLPIGEKASVSYAGRQIEGSVATLISAVRESLDKARQGANKGG